MEDNRLDSIAMVHGPARKEWHRPVLRKLPIATTANSSKSITTGNDGGGKGKGDVATLHS